MNKSVRFELSLRVQILVKSLMFAVTLNDHTQFLLLYLDQQTLHFAPDGPHSVRITLDLETKNPLALLAGL